MRLLLFSSCLSNAAVLILPSPLQSFLLVVPLIPPFFPTLLSLFPHPSPLFPSCFSCPYRCYSHFLPHVCIPLIFPPLPSPAVVPILPSAYPPFSMPHLDFCKPCQYRRVLYPLTMRRDEAGGKYRKRKTEEGFVALRDRFCKPQAVSLQYP